MRGFFQFAVTFGLFLITTFGLQGIISQAITGSSVLVTDAGTTALFRAFTLVGGPLLVGMVLWLRRAISADPRIADTGVATFFTTAASLISFQQAASALYSTLTWAFGQSPFFNRSTLVTLVVWGAAWGLLWWAQQRALPVNRALPHYALGSVATGVVSVVGLIMVLGSLLESAVGMRSLTLATTGSNALLSGLAVTIVGALGWYWYWIHTLGKTGANAMRLAYVLLAGVGGSLVLAITAGSIALYQTLVWFLGDHASTTAIEFFSDLPAAVAAVGVGSLSWWYHEQLVSPGDKRVEVNRLYDYIISGIGLIAGAVGLSIMVVALIESLTSRAIIAGGGPINTLLLAATLILVGSPVWWSTWRRVQHLPAEAEHGSPTRRIYLYLLFGIGGISAIICLLVIAYILFNDQISGALGTGTLRSMRYAVGILVSTAAVAGYHWTVYRGERDAEVHVREATRLVTLVGPADPAIERLVEERTGVKAKLWVRTDNRDLTWSVEEVAAAIAAAGAGDLLVVQDASGPFTIPLQR